MRQTHEKRRAERLHDWRDDQLFGPGVRICRRCGRIEVRFAGSTQPVYMGGESAAAKAGLILFAGACAA